MLGAQQLALLIIMGYRQLQSPLCAKAWWARDYEVSEVICELLCLRDRAVV